MAGVFRESNRSHTAGCTQLLMILLLVHSWRVLAMGDRKRASKSGHAVAQRDGNGGNNRHASLSSQSFRVYCQ
jgi:hypothetical protein